MKLANLLPLTSYLLLPTSYFAYINESPTFSATSFIPLPPIALSTNMTTVLSYFTHYFAIGYTF
jgi:hypothetical protein